MAAEDRDGELGASLGALLEPHLDALTPAQPAAAPPPRRLDEAELMALIFAHLDDDNPRVCAGIDFDRLVIMSESAPAAAPATQPAAAPTTPPEPGRPDQPKRAPGPFDPALAEAWIGASWTDEIGPLPATTLTHPELDAEQRQLLARARRRGLSTLNLRRLSRAAALHHLELFIHACRAQGRDLCRVITGKGVHSRDEPVIKRAVLGWCRAEGRAAVLAWAPELDRHAEWGALVLRVRLSSARNGGRTRP